MQCGASLTGTRLNAVVFGGALSLHDVNCMSQKEAHKWTVVDVLVINIVGSHIPSWRGAQIFRNLRVSSEL